MSSVDVYFSLGSNLGDCAGNIRAALSMMDDVFGVHYSALSGMAETKPWGFVSDNDFLNCCVLYALERKSEDASLDCLDVLRKCKGIERSLGRTGSSGRERRSYADRPIDIDILFFGQERIDLPPELIVPHPLIAERDFVTVPLGGIAKEDLKHAFPEIFD